MIDNPSVSHADSSLYTREPYLKCNSEAKSLRKLVIIRGNSGSGKTTVAKELQRCFGKNTMLISQDAVRMNVLNATDTEALPLMKKLLNYGYYNCEIVILEGIMNSDFYKPLFEFATELFDTQIYAYYFDLPFEETLKRHLTKPNCNEFGEKEMRRWWKEKDFSAVLKEIELTSEMGFESIVTDIIKTVLSK